MFSPAIACPAVARSVLDGEEAAAPLLHGRGLGRGLRPGPETSASRQDQEEETCDPNLDSANQNCCRWWVPGKFVVDRFIMLFYFVLMDVGMVD